MMRALSYMLFMMPLAGHAQVYFDSIYDIGQMTERCSNPLHTADGGYEFFTSGIDFGSGGGSRLNRHRIDIQGETTGLNSLYESGSRFEIGSIARTHDGGTVCLYSRTDAGTGYNFEVKRYSEDGNEVWTGIYGDSVLTHAPFEIGETIDSGFIFIGQVYSDTDGDMRAVSIGPSGDVKWQRTYGGTNYDSGNSVLATPDSGFLLLGWTRSYGVGQRDFYLVKTDSLGNQQWQRTYGGGGEDVGSSITKLNNGNYLLTGGGTNSAITTAKGFLFEVTPEGTQVWHKQYSSGTTPGDHLFQSLQLTDGSIVSVGLADNSSTGGNAGWLLKTDADGNELWQRKYNKNNNTDLFYSVLLANDGGFLLSGQARNTETNSQDAWLLKVDSVGCPYPNCLVGVDEMEKSKVVVDVWPNPASEVVNLEFQENGWAEMRLFDLTGTEVLHRQTKETQESMDVSHLPNGLYVLQVLQGSSAVSFRIIVQHD